MEYVALGTAVIGLIMLVFKYVMSDEAAKQRKEDQFQADEKARQAAADAGIQASQSQIPSQTAGAGSAWDAADQEAHK